MQTRLGIALLLGGLVGVASDARADLGVLVADGVQGPYRISVLASPAPLRAGRSQWNVLVQDAAGRSVEDAKVELFFHRRVHGAGRIRGLAGPGAHPFYRSSEVTLGAAAKWQGSVQVLGPEGSASLAFEVGVAPAAGPWREYAPALLAPLIAVGAFALHQSRALRRRRAEA